MSTASTFLKSLTAGAIALAAAPLVADDSEDPKLVAAHARHNLMEIMGAAFGGAGKIVRGDLAGPENLVNYAKIINKTGKLSGPVFAIDTRGLDIETESKDAIWENWDDFAAKFSDFQTASDAFYAAAKAGDQGAIRLAAGKLGGTCKACHKSYKAD